MSDNTRYPPLTHLERALLADKIFDIRIDEEERKRELAEHELKMKEMWNR